MTTDHRGNKWASPALRAAAIDYCIAQMPPPPSLSSPAGQDWLQRCSAACGPQLGLPARDLADILQGYRAADHIRLPDAPALAELPEHVVTQNTIAAGLAAPQETALEALMHEDESALDAAEMEELIAALETCTGLSDRQRSAVILLVRTFARDQRPEFVRGLLEWLCPQLTLPVYTVRRDQITLSGPCRIEVLPAIHCLETDFYSLNSQHIRLTEETTGRTLVFLYASASESIPRTPGTRRFIIRSLEPRGNQYDDSTVRKNLTLLTAYVSRDRRRGTHWAASFGETRAMVSHRRRRLTDRLNQNGGKTNLPGMKPHRDPRRGTKRNSQE